MTTFTGDDGDGLFDEPDRDGGVEADRIVALVNESNANRLMRDWKPHTLAAHIDRFGGLEYRSYAQGVRDWMISGSTATEAPWRRCRSRTLTPTPTPNAPTAGDRGR